MNETQDHHHEIPAKGRTLEALIVWLIELMIKMEKRMATFEENLTRLTQSDAQAKDRATELAAANQKIADLEAAAVTAAAALATAQANAITDAQATALTAATDALVTDTAAPVAPTAPVVPAA